MTRTRMTFIEWVATSKASNERRWQSAREEARREIEAARAALDIDAVYAALEQMERQQKGKGR